MQIEPSWSKFRPGKQLEINEGGRRTEDFLFFFFYQHASALQLVRIPTFLAFD